MVLGTYGGILKTFFVTVASKRRAKESGQGGWRFGRQNMVHRVEVDNTLTRLKKRTLSPANMEVHRKTTFLLETAFWPFHVSWWAVDHVHIYLYTYLFIEASSFVVNPLRGSEPGNWVTSELGSAKGSGGSFCFFSIRESLSK